MPIFTHEAVTYILFPNDYQFEIYREYVEAHYDKRMVLVERYKVSKRGVEAKLQHSRGLGAELRGIAVGDFKGKTVEA